MEPLCKFMFEGCAYGEDCWVSDAEAKECCGYHKYFVFLTETYA